MKAQAPNKIYIERDRNGRFSMPYWSEDPYLGHFEKVEYIRKDVVEHIIRSALGPQDALNKLRSL